ncbi:MAG: OB-fold nucleic acid binding domain-containing protein [Bacteroidia bacterium]
MSEDVELPEPTIPNVEDWGSLQKLKYEKEVVGFYISGHPLDDYRIEIKQFCNTNLSELKKAADLLKEYEEPQQQAENPQQDTPRKNGEHLFDRIKKKIAAMDPEEAETINAILPLLTRDIAFAGIITDVAHRVTKNGKPYGSITIEDFFDSYQIMLFGEDYLKYKHFMEIHQFLYVKGKFEKRFRFGDQIEFKISNIQILSEIRDTKIKQIHMNIELQQISPEFVENLIQVISNNKGICNVKLSVIDSSERMKIDMPSKSFKVNTSNDFFDALQKIPGLRYEIN